MNNKEINMRDELMKEELMKEELIKDNTIKKKRNIIDIIRNNISNIIEGIKTYRVKSNKSSLRTQILCSLVVFTLILSTIIGYKNFVPISAADKTLIYTDPDTSELYYKEDAKYIFDISKNMDGGILACYFKDDSNSTKYHNGTMLLYRESANPNDKILTFSNARFPLCLDIPNTNNPGLDGPGIYSSQYFVDVDIGTIYDLIDPAINYYDGTNFYRTNTLDDGSEIVYSPWAYMSMLYDAGESDDGIFNFVIANEMHPNGLGGFFAGLTRVSDLFITNLKLDGYSSFRDTFTGVGYYADELTIEFDDSWNFNLSTAAFLDHTFEYTGYHCDSVNIKFNSIFDNDYKVNRMDSTFNDFAYDASDISIDFENILLTSDSKASSVFKYSSGYKIKEELDLRGLSITNTSTSFSDLNNLNIYPIYYKKIYVPSHIESTVNTTVLSKFYFTGLELYNSSEEFIGFLDCTDRDAYSLSQEDGVSYVKPCYYPGIAKIYNDYISTGDSDYLYDIGNLFYKFDVLEYTNDETYSNYILASKKISNNEDTALLFIDYVTDRLDELSKTEFDLSTVDSDDIDLMKEILYDFVEEIEGIEIDRDNTDNSLSAFDKLVVKVKNAVTDFISDKLLLHDSKIVDCNFTLDDSDISAYNWEDEVTYTDYTLTSDDDYYYIELPLTSDIYLESISLDINLPQDEHIPYEYDIFVTCDDYIAFDFAERYDSSYYGEDFDDTIYEDIAWYLEIDDDFTRHIRTNLGDGLFRVGFQLIDYDAFDLDPAVYKLIYRLPKTKMNCSGPVTDNTGTNNLAYDSSSSSFIFDKALELGKHYFELFFDGLNPLGEVIDTSSAFEVNVNALDISNANTNVTVSKSVTGKITDNSNIVVKYTNNLDEEVTLVNGTDYVVSVTHNDSISSDEITISPSSNGKVTGTRIVNINYNSLVPISNTLIYQDEDGTEYYSDDAKYIFDVSASKDGSINAYYFRDDSDSTKYHNGTMILYNEGTNPNAKLMGFDEERVMAKNFDTDIPSYYGPYFYVPGYNGNISVSSTLFNKISSSTRNYDGTNFYRNVIIDTRTSNFSPWEYMSSMYDAGKTNETIYNFYIANPIKLTNGNTTFAGLTSVSNLYVTNIIPNENEQYYYTFGYLGNALDPDIDVSVIFDPNYSNSGVIDLKGTFSVMGKGCSNAVTIDFNNFFKGCTVHYLLYIFEYTGRYSNHLYIDFGDELKFTTNSNIYSLIDSDSFSPGLGEHYARHDNDLDLSMMELNNPSGVYLELDPNIFNKIYVPKSNASIYTDLFNTRDHYILAYKAYDADDNFIGYFTTDEKQCPTQADGISYIEGCPIGAVMLYYNMMIDEKNKPYPNMVIENTARDMIYSIICTDQTRYYDLYEDLDSDIREKINEIGFDNNYSLRPEDISGRKTLFTAEIEEVLEKEGLTKFPLTYGDERDYELLYEAINNLYTDLIEISFSKSSDIPSLTLTPFDKIKFTVKNLASDAIRPFLTLIEQIEEAVNYNITTDDITYEENDGWTDAITPSRYSYELTDDGDYYYIKCPVEEYMTYGEVLQRLTIDLPQDIVTSYGYDVFYNLPDSKHYLDLYTVTDIAEIDKSYWYLDSSDWMELSVEGSGFTHINTELGHGLFRVGFVIYYIGSHPVSLDPSIHYVMYRLPKTKMVNTGRVQNDDNTGDLQINNDNEFVLLRTLEIGKHLFNVFVDAIDYTDETVDDPSTIEANVNPIDIEDNPNITISKSEIGKLNDVSKIVVTYKNNLGEIITLENGVDYAINVIHNDSTNTDTVTISNTSNNRVSGSKTVAILYNSLDPTVIKTQIYIDPVTGEEYNKEDAKYVFDVSASKDGSINAYYFRDDSDSTKYNNGTMILFNEGTNPNAKLMGFSTYGWPMIDRSDSPAFFNNIGPLYDIDIPDEMLNVINPSVRKYNGLGFYRTNSLGEGGEIISFSPWAFMSMLYDCNLSSDGIFDFKIANEIKLTSNESLFAGLTDVSNLVVENVVFNTTSYDYFEYAFAGVGYNAPNTVITFSDTYNFNLNNPTFNNSFFDVGYNSESTKVEFNNLFQGTTIDEIINPFYNFGYNSTDIQVDFENLKLSSNSEVYYLFQYDLGAKTKNVLDLSGLSIYNNTYGNELDIPVIFFKKIITPAHIESPLATNLYMGYGFRLYDANDNFMRYDNTFFDKRGCWTLLDDGVKYIVPDIYSLLADITGKVLLEYNKQDPDPNVMMYLEVVPLPFALEAALQTIDDPEYLDLLINAKNIKVNVEFVYLFLDYCSDRLQELGKTTFVIDEYNDPDIELYREILIDFVKEIEQVQIDKDNTNSNINVFDKLVIKVKNAFTNCIEDILLLLNKEYKDGIYNLDNTKVNVSYYTSYDGENPYDNYTLTSDTDYYYITMPIDRDTNDDYFVVDLDLPQDEVCNYGFDINIDAPSDHNEYIALYINTLNDGYYKDMDFDSYYDYNSEEVYYAKGQLKLHQIEELGHGLMRIVFCPSLNLDYEDNAQVVIKLPKTKCDLSNHVLNKDETNDLSYDKTKNAFIFDRTLEVGKYIFDVVCKGLNINEEFIHDDKSFEVNVGKLNLTNNNQIIIAKTEVGKLDDLDKLVVKYKNNIDEEITLIRDTDIKVTVTTDGTNKKDKIKIEAMPSSTKVIGSKEVTIYYDYLVPGQGSDPRPAPGPTPTPTPRNEVVQTFITGGDEKEVKPGYVEGYDDYTFKPDKGITRAEFSKIMASAMSNFNANDINNKNYLSNFSDVNKESWYAPYVGYLVKCNIINGYSDNTFKPNEEITRAEAAKIISYMYNLEPVKDENSFDNELNGRWYKEICKLIINAGYMNGYPDGTFKANNKITRAETVSMINRVRGLNNIVPSESELLTAKNRYKDLSMTDWYFNDICIALFNK